MFGFDRVAQDPEHALLSACRSSFDALVETIERRLEERRAAAAS